MIKTEIVKLNKVRKKVSDLARIAVKNNEQIVQLLDHADYQELSQLKLPSARKIQALADEIDNQVVAILSLFCPEAADLRTLIAYLKISTELVRVHSNTHSFVKEFNKAFDYEHSDEQMITDLMSLYHNTLEALHHSCEMIDADSQAIKSLFSQVYLKEAQTDQLYRLVEADIFKLAHQSQQHGLSCLDLLKSIRRLEKIADRALNIASLLYFAKLGGTINQDIPVSI